jgi:acetyl coenzyme A synthetase (ADP forming)-like protein
MRVAAPDLRRGTYREQVSVTTDLDVFFRPRGVAVVGASRDPQKLGYLVVRNLMQHGYGGPIYPINPRGGEILGLPVYMSVEDAPDPLDLAVIALPAPMVADALEECGRRGVKGVIVFSGGFREVDEEGAAREDEIISIARQYGMRLIGPNCVGVVDTHAPLAATFVWGMPPPGDIALISQSGALCAAIINWAQRDGIGFSRMISLGNQADVSEVEMLRQVEQDQHTRVATAYIEGISDGRAFVEEAGQVARRMPVVAIKVGRTEGGVRAVSSHTGALAGSEQAYQAAFRRAGVQRAYTLEQLVDWARALAWQPLPRGDRVAVLTNSGGPGVLAVDAIEAAGLRVAPLTQATKDYLRSRLPPVASVNNPVDIVAGSMPADYGLCLETLLGDETVDAAVVITAPQKWFAPANLVEAVGKIARKHAKPVLSAIMGMAPDDEALDVLERWHIPNYPFPERVGGVLAAMWERKQWLDGQAIRQEPPLLDDCDLTAARRVIGRALDAAGGDGFLPPPQADELLAEFGIRTPDAGLALSPDEAVRLAERIGCPVALKLVAEGVTHKSEVGGVALNLHDADQVRDAFGTLMAGAGKAGMPPGSQAAAYVQGMIIGGVELIVGVVRDPQFGPLVMAGTGGTLVELLGDVAFELAPLTGAEAGSLLDRTGAGRLLAGWRGAPPADRDAVIDVILRMARLAVDLPQVAEIEINPLIVLGAGRGAWAVDARVRVERV